MIGTANRNTYLSTVLPVGFFVATIAIGLSPAGGALNFIFMPAALVLAIFLLLQQPNAYLGFVMWLWMLTPFVRRLSDWHSGYHEVSVVMVAPLAATAIAALTPLRYHQRLAGRGITPYIFYIAILVYGFFIGALDAGIPAAAFALANWAVPVVFAIHVLVSPEPAEDKARAILRALVFGTLVIGTYGVLQFVLLPPWDADWMIGSEMESIGHPVPFEVRVFSTLNSPGPYSAFVAAGVIAAFATRNSVRTPAIGVGALGLMLSLVRSTWGGWLIGMILVFIRSSVRDRNRLLAVIGISVVLVTPVVAFTPLGEGITARIATLSDSENDASLADRQALYSQFAGRALSSVVGVGLGQTGISTRLGSQSDSDVASIDSGLLEAFYTFGLLASVLFGSLAAMVIAAWPRHAAPLAIASMGVVISGIPILIFGNSLVGAPGMLVFPFLALARQLHGTDIRRALSFRLPPQTAAGPA